MFYPETVEPGSLELVRNLLFLPEFQGFMLVGGTALAMQIGHRKSVDIDLFAHEPFNADRLGTLLEESFGFELSYLHNNTLKGIIGNTFIDIMTHNYPLVSNPLSFNGITLASIRDIAAMKLNAISGNGTRVKDFIDVYFIMKNLSFEEIIRSFSIKYGKRNEFHALKSLTYFEDVDLHSWPEMILEPGINFTKIKKTLIKEQGKFLRSLSAE
jgi:hypothetical protein